MRDSLVLGYKKPGMCRIVAHFTDLALRLTWPCTQMAAAAVQAYHPKRAGLEASLGHLRPTCLLHF